MSNHDLFDERRHEHDEGEHRNEFNDVAGRHDWLCIGPVTCRVGQFIDVWVAPPSRTPKDEYPGSSTRLRPQDAAAAALRRAAPHAAAAGR